MIFADKLIDLRKKHGWSQEELAEKMDVTRQSVSKWESAQSVPDIEKIIRLSELFNVSTDYLLKDNNEAYNAEEKQENIRRVTIKEAEKFLRVKNETSKMIAFATFLCILSPVPLIMLGALSELGKYNLNLNTVTAAGMIIMFIFVAAAVSMFIFSGTKTSEFEFLENESFETERGLVKVVNDYREKYKNTYIRNIIIGVSACILSLVPMFVGIAINEDNEILMVYMVAFFFLIVGIGVALIIRSCIIDESFKKLLQEGEYSKREKIDKSKKFEFSSAYWLIATAVFFVYSIVTDNWEHSWIILAVAGIIYPIYLSAVRYLNNKK